MSRTNNIPSGVYDRLPLYLNCLLQLKSEGVEIVSSNRIGQLTDVNPAAIRRDLTFFGNYGIKGVGYSVEPMIREIRKILGSDQPHKIALVGAGNLGSAIAHHSGLKNHGFHVATIFDRDPARVGARLGGVEIAHIDAMSYLIKREAIDFGIIAVPPTCAQAVADLLIGAGISVILNYTSTIVRAPAGVRVHNADPVRELLVTLHTLSQKDSLVTG